MTNPRDIERGDEARGAPAPRQRREGPATSLRDDALAVVIGINTYQDPKIPDLRCARADAQAVYDVLTDPEVGRFKPQNVMLLLDADATERRIRSALGTQLPRRAPKDGTVVIYYAGHGAPVVSPGASGDGIAKYLVPHDALADDLEASAIPMAKIQEYFQRLNTSQVICFLDSCYSGSAGGRSFEYGDVQVRAVLTDEFLDSLANEGRFVVTSCATNEVSLESNALGHGVFTYYLVKGLQGAADADEDGKVTIDELYTYVYNNVEKEARALGGSMNPLRKGAVRGTVYLTEFEGGAQRAARLANKAGEIAWDRGDLARAEASWRELLRLEPGHERATFGLTAIAERRAREDADRLARERAREDELTRHRRTLLDLANAQELSMREFDEAMSLLEQDPDALKGRERTLRRYLDSLLREELSVRAYRYSSALLVADGSTGPSPAWQAPDAAAAPAPASAPPQAPRDSARVEASPSVRPTEALPARRPQRLVEAGAPAGPPIASRWSIGAAVAGVLILIYIAVNAIPKPAMSPEPYATSGAPAADSSLKPDEAVAMASPDVAPRSDTMQRVVSPATQKGAGNRGAAVLAGTGQGPVREPASAPGPTTEASPPPSAPSPVTEALTRAFASLATGPRCTDVEMQSNIMETVRDHGCRFMKSVGLAAIQQWAGMPIFASGPHRRDGLNLDSYRFGHYNPRFVSWATEHLIPQAGNLPPAWRNELRNTGVTYHQVNTWLTQRPDVMRKVRADYARAIAGAPPDPAPGATDPPDYHGPAFHAVYDDPSPINGGMFDNPDASYAAAFWLRREMDGTRPLFAIGLVKLLTALDPTFKP